MSNIAVVMPAYNAERTIGSATQSVLSSSVPVQLFIIDDGSHTPVSAIIPAHPAITVLRLPKNRGLSAALNHGLDFVSRRGFDYIARMDADDLCDAHRFRKQLAFMESNPDVTLVGAWARFFSDVSGNTVHLFRPHIRHHEIVRALPFNSPVSHPTWFLRGSAVNDLIRYDPRFDGAEDYELLCRMITKHKFVVANLPEFLLDYRFSNAGISVSKRRRQLWLRLKVQLSIFRPLTWRSYAGVLKTVVLLPFPVTLISALKKNSRQRTMYDVG